MREFLKVLVCYFKSALSVPSCTTWRRLMQFESNVTDGPEALLPSVAFLLIGLFLVASRCVLVTLSGLCLIVVYQALMLA